MDLTALTLSEAAHLTEGRACSPVELTRACLDRIARLDPLLNTFITLTAEAALQQAQEAEAAIGRGEYRGPLHGIPLALKDLYETQGVRTTAGSKLFADHIPAEDCTVVQRLRAAGAIFLGKLNMHELALGVINDNVHYGACRNPWDVDRIPGGSSGGAASALAARLCLGALGSDTRGSIRIPAALCGVVGLKPTYGRVSLRGVIPLSWHLDHAGPMARCVRDAALLLETIAAYDPADPLSVDAPRDSYLRGLEAGVRGWRVAVADDAYFTRAEPEIEAAFQAAVGVFAGLGAQISRVDLAWAGEARLTSALMVAADAVAYHQERLAARPEDFGPEVLARLRRDSAATAAEYANARHHQVTARYRFRQFFEEYDILLTPATPIAAAAHADPAAIDRARRLLSHFTAPFNMAGTPALSVPCGFTDQGLPIGLQIVGRHWAEAQVLCAGYAYEQATDWHRRVPPLE